MKKRDSPAPINETIIVLILKVAQSWKLLSFSQFFLCNDCYKVISNSIVNLMKGFINSSISKNQGAFVLGGVLFINAILGHECVHSIKSKREGKKW